MPRTGQQQTIPTQQGVPAAPRAEAPNRRGGSRLRGGLESGTTAKPAKKPGKKKDAGRKERKLARRACSWRWAVDTEHNHEPYPHDKMPLSKCKVLSAEPNSDVNHNPRGTRGEQRHTPPQCVSTEDLLDGMSTAEATDYKHPSSCGVVADIRSVVKGV